MSTLRCFNIFWKYIWGNIFKRIYDKYIWKYWSTCSILHFYTSICWYKIVNKWKKEIGKTRVWAWGRPNSKTPLPQISCCYAQNCHYDETGSNIRLPNDFSNCQHPLDHKKKQESSWKTSTSPLLTMPKPLIVWITTNCGKFLEMGIPDHLTCLLRNLYTGQEAKVKTGHGTKDWF